MNAPVYVDIDQGIHKVKLKVTRNDIRKKPTWGFFLHKHSKFCSISLEQKVECKPFISEE